MKKENYVDNDYPFMDISKDFYYKHCWSQKEKKVLIMCKPLSKIRNMSAEELLDFCGQRDNMPIDLKKMLEEIGISCVQYDFSSLEQKLSEKRHKPIRKILGALVTIENDATILYRKEEEPDSHRYRFTIAHELAHCCLSHYDVSEVSAHLREEGYPETADEKAANVFAGELLIPEHSLKEVLNSLLIPSLKTLVEIFQVSENVMKARLDYLKISDRIVGYNVSF